MTELKLNKYNQLLMELYENILVSPEKPTIVKIRSNKFPFKMIEKEIYPIRDNINERINKLADDTFKEDGMSFNDIWEFCQFIKFAEKIIFYNNEPTKLIYVDSNIDDMSKRQFIIANESEGYQLNFKLERSDDPIKHDILKIIKLTVSRSYGRKMTNEFIIVNSEIKYNDEADIYLIDHINRILASRARKAYEEIMCLVRMKDNGK